MKLPNKLWLYALLGLTGALLGGPAWADDNIAIFYQERPPYAQTGPEAKPFGLTADPVEYAFSQSGLAHRWSVVPPKRQYDAVETSMEKVCILGWFKNPERERIGKFTSEIYQDKPSVAVALANNPKMVSGRTIEETLADKNLTLLTVMGYSYGKFIDEKIRQFSPKIEQTPTGNMSLLEMISVGRGDYVFMAPEEAGELIRSAKFEPGKFKLVGFVNMPQGESRYLLCSKLVPDADIEKLNLYLQQYQAKLNNVQTDK